MISPHEAKRLIQAAAPPRRRVIAPLGEAFGKILSEDVAARSPSPRFASSSMDGYAVRAAEALASDGLAIAGESRAGAAFEGTLGAHEAILISTGAVLPAGADSVAPLEDAEENGESVRIIRFERKGQYVRRVGGEYEAGATLLKAGARVGAAEAALLAQEGLARVSVYQTPRFAVLTTGDELVNYDEEPKAGQIRDSNSVMLAAAIRDSGCETVFAERAPDSEAAVREALRRAVENADIALTVGGASVGRHDWIKSAAAALGFETVFWRVRQKPGKPLFFARAGEKLLFGLPGNPVSALMCYAHYAHPLARYLSGEAYAPRTARGALAAELRGQDDRAEFARVRLQRGGDNPPLIVPAANQESYMLTSVAGAHGYVFVEAGACLKAGTEAEVVLF